MTTQPLSRTEFARLHGVSASAVTQAIARGALELTGDGKAITPDSAEAWADRRATWAAGREHADRNAAADLERTKARLTREQQNTEQMRAQLVDRTASAAEITAATDAIVSRVLSDAGVAERVLQQAMSAIAGDLGDLQAAAAAVTG